jgi:hypothetical protein
MQTIMLLIVKAVKESSVIPATAATAKYIALPLRHKGAL